MSDLVAQELSEFYKPENVGTITITGKTFCTGFALDTNYQLVAAAFQGASTSVDSVWATIHIGKRIDLYNNVGYGGRQATTKGHSYVKYVTPIPDTNYISCIVLTKQFWEINDELQFIYIPIVADEEALKWRLFYKVRQICQIPVLEEWRDFLLMAGRGTERAEWSRRLITTLSKPKDRYDSYWQSKAFSIAQVTSNRQSWEHIITEGLKAGKISI